jgi:hypothetical protein
MTSWKLVMRIGLRLLSAGFLAALAGCGASQPGRLSGGTAGGAATGATFGLIGGPIGVVLGAGIGGAVGALTSTNTSPKQVNLGNPIWDRGGN